MKKHKTQRDYDFMDGIEDGKIRETDMNDFFRSVSIYCENNKSESFVPSRRILDINKEDMIIFEADFDKINLSSIDLSSNKLMLPTNKLFVEIPKMIIKDKKTTCQNMGGVLIFEEDIKDQTNQKSGIKINRSRKLFTVYTLWLVFDKSLDEFYYKPLSFSVFDELSLEALNNAYIGNKMYVGSAWKKYVSNNEMNEDLKRNIISSISNIFKFLLFRIQKKDYTSYKKWTPRGFETKEIIYSHEVSKHKRHFWEDSGRFKIPLMKKEEWEEKGYETDEVVFRDGEVRRDVPFKIIGNFLVGGEKEKKEDYRRIKLAKGKIWRCEEKIYVILREIYPDKIIRRHDRRTLKGLELDFNLPELRLGIEYDGEQHFNRELCEKVFKSNFDSQVSRDRRKDKLCKKKNIKLLRIKYDEPLTKTHIKNKLKSMGASYV